MRFVSIICLVFGVCCNVPTPNIYFKGVDESWLDSIKIHSDTTYKTKYRNNDFVTASYFINKKQQTVCQLMKDSLGRIRQIIVIRNDKRVFTAAYYANGQLIADLPLDSDGKYNGVAKFFYNNGKLQRTGQYLHGFYNAGWSNFDSEGKLVSEEVYDSHGLFIKSTRY